MCKIINFEDKLRQAEKQEDQININDVDITAALTHKIGNKKDNKLIQRYNENEADKLDAVLKDVSTELKNTKDLFAADEALQKMFTNKDF